MGAGLLAAKTATAPDVSMGHLLLQMIVAMAIIVGGIWVVGKLVGRSRAAGGRAGRKVGGLLRQRSQAHGLTVLSRQQLGKGKCLAVVQVGAQQFLVGIADAGVTPLGEIRTGDEALPGTVAAAAPVAVAAAVPVAVAPPVPVTVAPPVPVTVAGGDFMGRHAFTGPPEFGAAELASIDLGALGVRSVERGTAQSTSPAERSARTWFDALREATVRR